MGERYLAFDLGAESGRVVLGELEERGRLRIVEIHRFANGTVNIQGHLHWDIPDLYEELVKGIRLCAEAHTPSPASIGIDTWGVDFGLLDERGNLLELPFTYRDSGTQGAMGRFLKRLPGKKLYGLTGIQILPINTVFQLYAMAQERNLLLEAASDLLFIPDLFHYLFTGVKKSEFTFATTSQLYNPRTRDWDPEIFAHLAVSRNLMQDIVQPGTLLGETTETLRGQTGLMRTPVVAVATHDTGSAVAALPVSGDDFAYISSGTWSLVGIESPEPIITDKAFQYNLTNEGGVGKTFRVLKNITGLWLIRECRKAWAETQNVSYEELIKRAEGSPPFTAILDPDRAEFLNPPDMPAAINAFCRDSGQATSQDTGQMVRIILEGLALAYHQALEQVAETSGRDIKQIHIIGGGSRNRLLCQFTADATGIPVYAGPVEATAIGNILVQAMALGTIKNLEELRKVVRKSFTATFYKPSPTADWDKAYNDFLKLKQWNPDERGG
jgi:rhamnulokinase